MKKLQKTIKPHKPRFRKTRVVGSVCCYCSRQFITPLYKTVEHIIPTSKGGTDKLENLLNACNECNSWRGNDNYEDWYAKVKLMLFNNKTLKFRTYTRIDLQNILENLNRTYTGLGDLYKTHI